MLKGKPVRDNLIMNNFDVDFAIRRNEWKLILRGNQTVNSDKNELYNLKEDSVETKNIINAHPDVTKELIQLMN